MTQRYAGATSVTRAREHESSFGESEDEKETSERELKSQVKNALRDEAAYRRDEFEDIVTVLQKLGVTNIRHFKHVQIEDLIAGGLPLVTSRILMSKFGDKDGNANKKEYGEQRKQERIQRKSCWKHLMQFLDHYIVRALASLGFGTLEAYLKSLVADHFDAKRERRRRKMQETCRTEG